VLLYNGRTTVKPGLDSVPGSEAGEARLIGHSGAVPQL